MGHSFEGRRTDHRVSEETRLQVDKTERCAGLDWTIASRRFSKPQFTGEVRIFFRCFLVARFCLLAVRCSPLACHLLFSSSLSVHYCFISLRCHSTNPFPNRRCTIISSNPGETSGISPRQRQPNIVLNSSPSRPFITLSSNNHNNAHFIATSRASCVVAR